MGKKNGAPAAPVKKQSGSRQRLPVVVLAALLALSLGSNAYQGLQALRTRYDNWIVVDYPTANSRDTYFSIHNIGGVHETATGAGVKVGILDWGFAYREHEGLYAGGANFTGDDGYNFNHVSEHGYWMANVLKEIAPGCEAYALGTFIPDDEEAWVDALIAAVGWAEENGLDILTLSHQPLSAQARERFDPVADRAVEHGIVTTFIHCDNPNNILPGPLWEGTLGYSREADLRIFHYDYNTLFVTQYQEAVDSGENTDQLYLSISSMSPVTAGFVAILIEIDGSLAPAEYRQLLQDTSQELYYRDPGYPERAGTVGRVVDLKKAVEALLDRQSR